jgi:hypothetical protein
MVANSETGCCAGLVLVLVLLMSNGVAPRVDAQTPPNTLEEVTQILKPGDRVEIIDVAGKRHRGRIAELSAAAVILEPTQTDGRTGQRLAQAPILQNGIREIRVEQHDSVVNGTIGGAALAAAPFVIGVIGSRSRGISDPLPITAPFVPALLGAIAGFAVDASVFRKATVYRAPGAGRSRLLIAPAISSELAGVALSVRF